MDLKTDDPKLENAKVILINAPCSKSALMNPMEFLFQEGEGFFFLQFQIYLKNFNVNSYQVCFIQNFSYLKKFQT